MHASRFSCPHCAAVLRIKDRQYIGRRIDCPDCGRPIEIVGDGRRGFTGQLPASEAADNNSAAKPLAGRASMFVPNFHACAAAVVTPVGIAWLVAGVMTVVFTALLWPTDSEPATAAPLAVGVSESPEESVKPEAAGEEETAPAEPPTWKPPVESVKNVSPGLSPPQLELPAVASVPVNSASAPPRSRLFDVEESPAVTPPSVATVPETEPPQTLDNSTETDLSPTPDPEPIHIDVAAALEQPILSFRLTRPISGRDLLLQLEEMAGVPIQFDAADAKIAAQLDQRVSLEMNGTTVGGILDAFVNRLGLKYEIESDGVRLQRL